MVACAWHLGCGATSLRCVVCVRSRRLNEGLRRQRSAFGLVQGTISGAFVPRHATLLGQLFESLVTQSVRVYAQAAEADTYHLRTREGTKEIDVIVQRHDHRVLVLEVELNPVAKTASP